MQNINKTPVSLFNLFRTLTFFLAIFLFSQSAAIAQCGGGGSESCADSEVIAFPFFDRMLEENGPDFGNPIPGCNGNGVFHNTTWYQIIPTTPTIQINIVATNCTDEGAGPGIQAGLYTICDPNSPPVGGFVQCDCVGPGVGVNLGGDVIPGTPYYIMIDGCGGSTCDLNMNITEGAVLAGTPPNLGTPDAPTTGDPIPTCPGQELTFTVPEVNDADIYTWNLPPGTTIVSQNCETIIVIWGPNEGNVSVSTTNTTNFQTTTGPPLFVTIEQPMYSHPGAYCSPENGGYIFYGDGMMYSAGFYQISVPAVGGGCDTLVDLTVTENLIAIAQVIPTDVSCNSGNDGPFDDGQATIFMQNTGGAPYSFNWEGSNITGPTNNQLPVGTTGVTVTDSRGCTVETFVDIGEPPFLSVDVGFQPGPSCEGAMDGQANVIVYVGGIPANNADFTFQWSGGPVSLQSNSPIRTDITTGVNYELIVTNANGCFSENIYAAVPPSGGAITATESNKSAESCTGANNGSVTLTGDGPGTFTFTWPGPIDAATRNDLAAGTYDVTISNGTGCTSVQSVTIDPGSSFTVNPPAVTDVSCFGDLDGTITTTAMGATAPVTYSVGSGTVSGNVISNLATGNYTLTVTDGAGCSTEVPVSVGTPTEFLPTIANTPVTCGGSGNGTATVTPNGGTGPYTYMWNNGQTTQTISGLSGGMVSVVVTDANMCSVTLDTDVDGGGSLGVSADPANTQLMVSCPGAADGSIAVTVTGATGAITYDWTGSPSTTETADGLAPGTYSVIATDGAGCASAPFELTITAPDPIVVMPVGTTPTSCEGGNDGTAEVSVSGGTGTNYTFLWNNSGETTNPATGLEPGPHTVTVRDENNCSVTFDVMITEPDAITAIVDPVNESCAGEDDGMVTVTAMGGSGTYSYDIGLPSGPQTSNVFNNLEPANDYIVTITNADGTCQATVPVIIMEQTEITATITPTDVSCAGEGDGQASVAPSGGAGGYTYLWSDANATEDAQITGQDGGGFFVTVTDMNGCSEIFSTVIPEPSAISVSLDSQTDASCDGTTGGTASVDVIGGAGGYTYTWSAGTNDGDGEASNIPPGPVTVVVEDSNGCMSAAFSITIDAPDPVTLMEDQITGETCFEEEDGEVTVMTNGGNGPFEFNLNGDVNTTQNSNEFTNLAPGNYTVNVIDDNGCTDFVDITIPAANEIVGSVDAASTLTVCDGFTNGSVTIDASGGDGNLTYQLDSDPAQTSNEFSDLGDGSYTVTVMDGNGCSIQVPVQVNELPAINLDIDLANSELTVCNGDVNGAVSIDANGGDNNFTYSLVGGPQDQNSNVFSTLGDGAYTVVVMDGNGCTNEIDFNVSELAPIMIDIDGASDLIVCAGANDGTATITASGGDNNLTYSIPGEGSNMDGAFTGLGDGAYTVTVMDGNMCSESFDFNVALAPAITVDVDAAASELTVCDGEDGAVTIDAGGGDGDFTYTLGTVTQDSPVFEDLPADAYTVLVEDGNGCTQDVDFTVVAADPIIANIAASDLLVCNGFTDGSVTIAASGGDENFTYDIDNTGDQPNNVFDNLAPGPHTVEITDGNGCTTAPIDFTVVEGPEISASIEAAASDLLVCDGATDGSITITASGGTGTLMYSIDNNVTQQTINEFTNLGEGDYTVTIIDSDGCSPMAVPVSIAAADPVVGTIDAASVLSICNGETVGSIVVDGSGGDGNLTYTLNPGNISQPTNVFADLPAGDYTIDIVDGNNCTTPAIPAEIIEVDLVTATFDPNSDLINCFGDTDGSITINANGGNGGFMYDIGNGTPQASNNFNDLAPGTYFITVTDMNNCPADEVEVTVVELPELDINLTVASSDLTVCSGVADATAAFEATGGDGTYSYALDAAPAQGSNIFDGIAEGPHTVTVIDGNGCEQAIPFMVEAAPAIVYTPAITNVNCFGESEGEITIDVTGGDGPFEFVWSSGQVGPTAQVLPAGTETVTITDVNMCEVIETFTIMQPAAALAIDGTAAVIEPATCGETNGSISSVVVSGGTAPYNYLWSDGSTDPDLIDGGPGNYIFTVTDALGCTAVSGNFNVSEPGALEVTPTTIAVACNGDNTGSIELAVQGGTAPYTFVWSDISEDIQNRDLLTEGTYVVEVSDASGCILPALTINVTQPEPIMATLTPTQASCGASDGSVSLVVEGGTGVGTYTYDWGISNEANLNGVPAGIYDVTITDQNMCQFISQTVEVTNPGTPELTITGTDVSCFGESTGAINVGIMGGSGGNMITWTTPPAAPNIDGLVNPTNLPAGDYIATVIDNSMCSSSIPITIAEPAAPIEITEIAITQATCGNDNGSVTISVSGGTGNYTYDWSIGNGTTTNSGLPSGSVTVTVTDQNMCTSVEEYTVAAPGELQVDLPQTTVVDATCNGTSTGSINVAVIGGVAPYQYVWADGFGTSENISNLPAGSYSLSITDNTGCEVVYLTTVNEPAELTATSESIMANCGESNGGINITVSGGTEPYDFEWSDGSTDEDLSNAPAGSGTVIITDVNGCEFTLTDEIENPNPPVIDLDFTDVTCNGTATGTAMLNVSAGSGVYIYDWSVPGITGENPTNLSAGIYTVTVSDNLNCSVVANFEVNEPMPLVLTTEELVQATCGNANGSVDITVTGGTMPYNFDWGNGITTEDLSGLVPGTYELNFTDGNGCTLNESFDVLEPDALNVQLASSNDVDCPGGDNGSIQVMVEGGSGPGTYTFLWSNDDTDEINDNLAAGTYTLTVTDEDDCSFIYSQTLTEPDPITVTGTTVDAVCGEANGSIDLTVEGGTGDYTYIWDNGAAPVEDPTGLVAAQYNVTITDQNNCQAEPFSIAVTSPNAPQIESTFTDVSCNGANDGSIDFTVTGGIGNVVLTLNGQIITETTINNLPPGVYELVAEDEEACRFPSTITITEPLLLEAFVVDPQSSTLCNGSSDGSIELTVQGGTGDDYTFQWTNGAGSMQNPDNLSAGVYDVTVTDENGCTATESVTITEPDAIALSATPSPASCSNTADGAIEISFTGGTGELEYDWNNGQFTDQNIEDLQPGNYSLVVTDQNGCNGTIDVTVEAPSPVTINLADVSDFNGFNTSCNESEDGSITVSAEGGNGGYSYAWADGTNGPTISEIGQGNYSVIVTDQEGCTGENNFSIDAPAPIVVEVETDEPDCFGENNGVIIVNGVEGGRLPYRYSLNNGDYTTAQFFGNLGSGTYSLAVEDANGCTSDLDVVVDEVEELTVSLSLQSDTTIVLGDSLTLSPQTRIALDSNFVWSITFDNDTLQGTSPTVRPFSTTAYAITVTDEFGCTATDELLVQVTKPRLIYIPNAFNPNSVNGNDRWVISGGQDVAMVESLDIYNRWGEVVYADREFLPNDPSRAWDGNFRSQEAQPGVYVYIIKVAFIDGHTEMYSGDITLLR